MARKWLLVPALLLMLLPAVALAQDYKVEAFEGAPPDGLAPEIAEKISASGLRVSDGDRVVCEIWPAKELQVNADFTPSATVLYPLKSGSLVGALRFPRKGADFRGQDIKRGLYTLRYANQPVDGNHVGTFDTRDFLVMVPAAVDKAPDATGDTELFPESAESAGSTHPAIMPLVKPDSGGELPALRHLEEQEWYTLRFGGKDSSGKQQVLEVVVVGKAAE
ncbi:MAG: hypothetical protein AB7O59_16440 [Pirellulales bacterium]